MGEMIGQVGEVRRVSCSVAVSQWAEMGVIGSHRALFPRQIWRLHFRRDRKLRLLRGVRGSRGWK